MRIGILGLGRIGAFHAETLSGLDAVESLVLTDPFAEAAKSAAERFGGEVVDSPEALLAAGVEGIGVAAAPAPPPKRTRAGEEAGPPVFGENPAPNQRSGGVEAPRAVGGGDVPTQIGYNRRF